MQAAAEQIAAGNGARERPGATCTRDGDEERRTIARECADEYDMRPPHWHATPRAVNATFREGHEEGCRFGCTELVSPPATSPPWCRGRSPGLRGGALCETPCRVAFPPALESAVSGVMTRRRTRLPLRGQPGPCSGWNIRAHPVPVSLHHARAAGQSTSTGRESNTLPLERNAAPRHEILLGERRHPINRVPIAVRGSRQAKMIDN